MVAALALLASWTGTQWADAQAPPSNLQQVGDHWTAWSPPVPPEGADVHIIQPGDTLWDLAATLLGDPYLWPQLWEANQYILDAHWIYPGDPLIMPGAAQVYDPSVVAGEPLDEAAADGLQDELAAADEVERFWAQGETKVPTALGSESQIYCSGYISDAEEELPYAIGASEFDFLMPEIHNSPIKRNLPNVTKGLLAGDIIYLDSGRADGLSAGELLSAIEPQDEVTHPVTGDRMGRFYKHKGRVRVLSVQEDTAIAEIIRSCEPMDIGTKLRLFEPEPVPLRRRTPIRPVNFPADPSELEDSPIIIMSYDNVVSFGQGYLVFIDRGEAQDVLPGDVFTVYRRGRNGYPPVVVGELGVLAVTENAALANITESRTTIYVGDALVLK